MEIICFSTMTVVWRCIVRGFDALISGGAVLGRGEGLADKPLPGQQFSPPPRRERR